MAANDIHSCGECEWFVDDSKCLVIRPAGGAAEGELADWHYGGSDMHGCPEWSSVLGYVAVRVEGTVYLPADATRMFCGASKLSDADLSGLDTSKTRDMAHMFSECSSLETLDLSGFDTSKVEDMEFMFSGCKSLKALDLSAFDTSEVWCMDSMFENCSSLETLDLSAFDTSAISDVENMFEGCDSLREVKTGEAFSLTLPPLQS